MVSLNDKIKLFKLEIFTSELHYDFCGICLQTGKLITCESVI